MHCDSNDYQQKENYFWLEQSHLVLRRTGHVSTILWERLGVTVTMVLLQRFESKVYENGCNALTTACNASHSYVILVHTMHFALEQKQINETRKLPCHNTWEIR